MAKGSGPGHWDSDGKHIPHSSLLRAGLWIWAPTHGHGLLRNLVDPASSHMLVSKIKPCMSQYKLLYGETANGSLKQL